MPKLQGPVFNFIRFFNKLVKELRTYADDHPAVRKDLQSLTAALDQAYKDKTTFSLGRDQDSLSVQDEIVGDKSEVVATFLTSLKTTRIAKFILQKGTPPDEIIKLIRLAGMKAEEVVKDKRIRPELLQPFRIIKVIEARYVLITDEQEVVEKGGGGGEGGGGVGAGGRGAGAGGGGGGHGGGPGVGGPGGPGGGGRGTRVGVGGGTGGGPGGGPGGGGRGGPGGGVGGGGPGGGWPGGGGAGVGTAESGSGAGGEAELDPAAQLDQAFEHMRAGAGDGAGGPGADAPLTVEGVVDFFQRINPYVAGLEKDAARDKLNHFLVELLGRALRPEAGLQAALDAIRQALLGLPAECQELLFGAYLQNFETKDLIGVLRRLDPALHAGIVKSEILSGAFPADELRAHVEMLAPVAEEFLELMKGITTDVIPAPGAPEEVDERMKRLFHLFPCVQETQTVKRKVLIVDADEASVARYLQDLQEFGYEVAQEANGKNALETFLLNGPFDCVILDLQLPGADGVEVLKRLRAVENAPPVVVTTSNARLRAAPEVKSHPRLRFLAKPVEPADVMVAVMDLCPQEEQAPEDRFAGDEFDLARAREVQLCLVPPELPAIEGFDLDALQQTTREVSGDYYDVIPLPHGRFAFVMADVSGKDAAGAMVMALVRTLFRSLAPVRVSPKAMLKDVNRYLVKDVRRGMLATAVYGVLDPLGHVMMLANAGHSPPALWSQRAGATQILPLTGVAMGMHEAWRFEADLKEVVVRFEPNDRLILYTDGVTACMSPAAEEFGEGRLVQVANRHHQVNAAGLLDGVVQALAEHRGTAEMSDDITLLVCRYGLPGVVVSVLPPPAVAGGGAGAARDTGRIVGAPGTAPRPPGAPLPPVAPAMTPRGAAAPGAAPAGAARDTGRLAAPPGVAPKPPAAPAPGMPAAGAARDTGRIAAPPGTAPRPPGAPAAGASAAGAARNTGRIAAPPGPASRPSATPAAGAVPGAPQAPKADVPEGKVVNPIAAARAAALSGTKRIASPPPNPPPPPPPPPPAPPAPPAPLPPAPPQSP